MTSKPPQTSDMHWTGVCKRLPSHRSEVARMCEAHPEAHDLMATNPALGLCIACAGTWDTLLQIPKEGLIERLLGSKRRVAAGLLGFPESDAAVKLLSKIEPEACSVARLMRLRLVLRREGILRTLQHVHSISADLLSVVAYWRWGGLASVALLEELARGLEKEMVPQRTMTLLDDTVEMSQQLHYPFRPIQSIGSLERLHDRLAQEAVDAEEARELAEGAAFPAPPLPGNEWIEPISSSLELIAEGKNQHHCVGAMAGLVRNGSLYVYRVLAPERATLSLKRHDGRWSLDQLYAACNRPVSKRTSRQVKKWLQEHTPAS